MLPDKFFTVFHLSQVDRRGAMSMEESARVGDESGLDVGESFCELAARGHHLPKSEVGGRLARWHGHLQIPGESVPGRRGCSVPTGWML